MIIRLFPRLSRNVARQLIQDAQTASAEELEADRDLLPARGITWAPTGGNQLTRSDLVDLREHLRDTARRHGYLYGTNTAPLPPRSDERLDFDRALMRTFRAHFPLSVHEASRSEVWTYMSCILAPELIRWRWGNDEGKAITYARFGGSLLRNAFARLWWRGERLRDEGADDPYGLVTQMGEDDIFQLMERGEAATRYRPLACSIARNLVPISAQGRRLKVVTSKFYRNTMMRLVRLRPMLSFESLDEDTLDEAVRDLFQVTLNGMGVTHQIPPLQESLRPASMLPDPSWSRLSRRLTHRFHAALTEEEVAILLPLCEGGKDKEPRWRLQHHIHRPCTEVLAALTESSRLRLSSALGCRRLHAWFVSIPAGSWVTDTRPERAEQLLSVMSSSSVQALSVKQGWLKKGVIPFGDLRPDFHCRYDGSWQEVIDVLEDDELKALNAKVDLPDAENPREQVRLWLLRDPNAVVEPAPAAPPPAKDKIVEVATVEQSPPEEKPLTAPKAPEVAPKEPDLTDEPPLPYGQVEVSELARGDTDADNIEREAASSAPPAPKARPTRRLPDKMPEPPGALSFILTWLNIETVEQLAALDMSTVSIPGADADLLQQLAAFQEQVLGPASSPPEALAPPPARPVPLPAPEPAAPSTATPLPRPPDILKNLLRRLRLETVEDVLAFDLAELNNVARVGEIRKRQMGTWQRELAEQFQSRPAPSLPPAANPLLVLTEQMLAPLDERRRSIVQLRYEEDSALLPIGEALGVTRARISSLLLSLKHRLEEEHGETIRTSLESAYRLAEMDGQLLRLNLQPDVPVWIARFLAECSAPPQSWTQLDDDHLTSDSRSGMKRQLSEISQIVAEHDRLSREQLDVLSNDIDISPTLFAYLLRQFEGWSVEGDGSLVRSTS